MFFDLEEEFKKNEKDRKVLVKINISKAKSEVLWATDIRAMIERSHSINSTLNVYLSKVKSYSLKLFSCSATSIYSACGCFRYPKIFGALLKQFLSLFALLITSAT